MIRVLKYSLFLGLASVIVFATAPSAWAALGGAPEGNAVANQNATAGVRKEVTHPGYTVYESASDVLNVREYAGPDGIVFGVVWEGQGQPDLEKLFGSYYQKYSAADSKTPRAWGRRSRRVESDGIIVETWGFMRNRHGRAYAPDLIPSGVTSDEIQ